MAEPFDERERASLCDLFSELGADAPTLCTGWTTADLAAHLVLREHFHRWPPVALAKEKAKGYAPLVDRLRAGPPIPWRLPGVRFLANGTEFLIHQEDVRRANGMPRRNGDPELSRSAWRIAGLLGRRLAHRASGVRVTLDGGPGRRHAFGKGVPVTISGDPVDLTLYLSGRQTGVDVSIDGAEEGRRAVEAANSRL